MIFPPRKLEITHNGYTGSPVTGRSENQWLQSRYWIFVPATEYLRVISYRGALVFFCHVPFSPGPSGIIYPAKVENGRGYAPPDGWFSDPLGIIIGPHGSEGGDWVAGHLIEILSHCPGTPSFRCRALLVVLLSPGA